MVKKEVKDAIIKSAKERYKGQLFLAEYSFVDRDETTVELCFAYREPTAGEIQAYTEMAGRDAVEASRWLMKQLVVSMPDDKDVLDVVGPHNAAVATFMTEYINPLYGKVLEISPIQSL